MRNVHATGACACACGGRGGQERSRKISIGGGEQ